MKCPKCQTENPEENIFCSKCGIKLLLTCPYCGSEVLRSNQLCGKCGQKLTEAVETEKSFPATDSERKHVTVLFSDLSGYTAMSERLDPEEVKMIMGRIFGEIAQVVNKYEGFIEKFLGDAAVGIFGVPKAHEDDAVRAIKAAIEIHDMVETISPQLEERVGRPLLMHTGINTGLVVTGEVSLEKGTHGIIGDTINLASRLGGLARAGEILVGQDTYRQTKEYFNFERLKPTKVKGKSKPVQVYRVLSPEKRPSKMHSLPDLRSDLVGRKEEMALLEKAIEGFQREHRGGIVSVIGDAGIGKSRLVAELRTQLAGNGSLWLEGRALSYGQSISYWPFLEIIKSYTGITEKDDAVKSWTKLGTKINALFPGQVAEILPYLATLLSLEVRGELAERVRYLDGEAIGRQIFRSSRRFFEGLAKDRPLILEFEDFHWIDRPSVELLEHLLPLIRDVPLLICIVSRLEKHALIAKLHERVAQEYHGCYTEINLSPFSHEDSVQLVRNLLKIDSISPQMRGLILLKCEGNPLYIEQVIRMLIDIGTVEQTKTTGRWRVNPLVGKAKIPDTLRGLINASIDRLDENTRNLLKAAAVIGRRFSYRVLQSISEAGQELDQQLSKLQELGLIRKKSGTLELEYIFGHSLIKEAAYESMLLQQRRRIHHKVGKAIETIFGEHLEKLYGLLAYHYALSEDWDKAQDYLFKAGDYADKVAADSEALAHYKKAMAACEEKFSERLDSFQRAVFERKIGEILFRQGEHQKAIDSLHRALIYLGSPFPTSRWGVRLAIAKNLIIQVLHRLLQNLMNRYRATEVNLSVEERARVQEIIGWIYSWSNRERFLLNAVMGLNFFERIGFSSGIARSSMAIGLICDLLSKFFIAIRYHSYAIAVAEQIQNPHDKALCYLGQAVHEDFIGNWDKAIELYQRAAEFSYNYGDLHRWCSPTIMLAEVHVLKGEFKHCIELSQNVVQVGQETADQQVLGWGLSGLGRSKLRIGALDEAVGHLQQSVELLKAVPDYLVFVWSNTNLGLCYLRQGMLEKAQTVLEENNQIVAEHVLRGPIPTFFRNTLAEAFLVATDQAEEIGRASALRRAKGACRAALKEAKRFRCGLPQACRLQGTYRWLRGKHTAAQKWWQRSLDSAQELGAKYDEGMTYLEMGKRMKKSTYLEYAKTIFTEIGAKFDLDEVEIHLYDKVKDSRLNVY